MAEREWSEADEDALRRLVDDGTLQADQADAVRRALTGDQATPAPRNQLFEVLGYVGAGLVLAGIVLLVGSSWDELSRGGRVGLLSSVAALLIGAGLGIAGQRAGWQELRAGRAPVRRRVVGTCFGLAGGAAGFAAGVAAGVDNPGLLVGGLVGLAVCLAGFVALPTALGLFAAAAMSVITLTGIADEIDGPPYRMAAPFIVVGAAWAGAALAGWLPPRATGLGVGSAIALIGAQLPLFASGTENWAYAATLVVALTCLAGYLRDRTLILLVAGVVGVTIVVPEAVSDWSDGRVSGAALVVIAGAVLLLTGGLGLRLRKSS